VDAQWIYQELLDAVLGALRRRDVLVTLEEMVEVVAFQQAALEAAERRGTPVRLPSSE
jgi:hypothetical protein